MGCFGGGSSPTPDTSMQDAMSDISREDYENFKLNYAHLADELVQASNSDEVIRENVNTARARVAPAFDSSKGQIIRQVSRNNMPLTADQRTALQKSHNLNKSRTLVDVSNRARDSSADLQDQLRGDVVALGQGQKDAAMGDYSAAASLEQNRNMTNTNNSASHKAGMAQLFGSAASLASSALILSSRKAKTKVKPADKSKAASEMRELKVKNYDYKAGMGPKGERTGVIAEDSPAVATPDGGMVDLGDWTGKLTLALQDVTENVEQMQSRVLKLEKRVS